MASLNYYGQPTQSPGGGVPGPPGNPGSPGPLGLLFGAGDPNDANGANGQGYINTNVGDLWTKTSGHWTLAIPLVGPESPALPPIEPLLFGPANPTNIQGGPNQTWLNTTTFDIFFREYATWALVGNLKGGAGNPGTPGDPGAPGLGFANVVAWQTGVAYPIVSNQRPVVTYQGETYTSNTNVPSRVSFTSGDWVKITQKGTDGAASIPANVALLDAPNAFGKVEITGGLLNFTSFNFAQMPTLTISAANEATYLAKEIGFSSNTNVNIFEIRISGDVSKGFNMKIRREGTAKVRVVPDNTNAIGHHEDIPTIDATHPAYIANQYGAALIEVRFKLDSTHCDFFVDGRVATS